MSSAGKRLLQEESLRKGCVSSAGDYACRAADIKHLSAGSLPGTPVGRAVVLQKVGLDTFWSQRWKGLATQAHCHMGTLEKLLGSH